MGVVGLSLSLHPSLSLCNQSDATEIGRCAFLEVGGRLFGSTRRPRGKGRVSLQTPPPTRGLCPRHLRQISGHALTRPGVTRKDDIGVAFKRTEDTTSWVCSEQRKQESEGKVMEKSLKALHLNTAQYFWQFHVQTLQTLLLVLLHLLKGQFILFKAAEIAYATAEW